MAFNRYMLTLGREARKMTQADLATSAHISQGKISKIEHGLLQPSDEDISTFARVLGFPEPFFAEPMEPAGFPPYHFRRRKRLSAKSLNFIHATMNILRMHIGKLVDDADLDASKSIPSYAVEKFNDDVSEVARLVREYWGLPKGPVPNIVRAIEGAGGIVVLCDFGTKDLDALSQRIKGLPPLFFVNRNIVADRMRFTLAHELGHLVLHEIPDTDDRMEWQADEFAGSFLMPAEEIRPSLANLTIERLARLKAYWKVSMAALLMRAKQLRVVTAAQADRLWRQMSRAGYRTNEPMRLDIEQPQTLKTLIDVQLKEIKRSVAEVAELLHMRFGEFTQDYLGQKPGPTSLNVAAA